ncbi:MAG: peptide deformylase, partial [Patescibacteria group bacterium]
SDPVVRTQTKPIDPATISTPEFQTLIDDMIQTMYETNGIGLAATQIGKPLRLATLVPDPDRFDFYEKGSREAIVIINPTITSHSLRTSSSEEGCLSVPGYMGLVKRYSGVTVSFTDRTGAPQTVKARGLLARCYQHEIDHLNGILFVDRAEKIFKIQHI